MISPSLHAAYSGISSHLSLSSRLHSQGPPVCERRDAYKWTASAIDPENKRARKVVRRGPQKKTYIDSNDVCHGGKSREAGSYFPEEGCTLNLLGLRDVSYQTGRARRAKQEGRRTCPVPESRNILPKRDLVIQSSAASAKSLKPQNRDLPAELSA